MNKIAESTILCNDVPENRLDPNSALKTVCYNYPEAKADLRLPYDDGQLVKSWAVDRHDISFPHCYLFPTETRGGNLSKCLPVLVRTLAEPKWSLRRWVELVETM